MKHLILISYGELYMVWQTLISGNNNGEQS